MTRSLSKKDTVVFEKPVDLTIVSEEEDELTFVLEGYDDYHFTVQKAKLFPGFKATRQKMVLILADQALADRISNDKSPASNTKPIQAVYVKELVPIK
ncbi:MAG: hypothetical protein AB8G15_23190 [Saprospiraceae bacterium]